MEEIASGMAWRTSSKHETSYVHSASALCVYVARAGIDMNHWSSHKSLKRIYSIFVDRPATAQTAHMIYCKSIIIPKLL